MAQKTSTTLVSPDGAREYTTADRAEVTNLVSRGWKNKPAAKAAPAVDAKK